VVWDDKTVSDPDFKCIELCYRQGLRLCLQYNKQF
jgi:hypothetical protein